MTQQLQIARQPILNSEKEIFGYEFFYRNDDGSRGFDDPRAATSSVLVNIINQVGIKKSVGDAKAFINLSSELLLTDIIPTLPKNRFVFELSENIIITQRERESIRQFYESGYDFALDNVSFSDIYLENFSSIFPYITYAKFNTTAIDIEQLPLKIAPYKKMTLIAQRVEIPEVFEAYKRLGFTYFQGYFFAKPNIIQQNRLDPRHLGVIRLFNMLQSNTPIDQVTKEFERHNELTMQLLQYLNSATTFELHDVDSVRDIIKLIGKKKLLQWLLMIIYSKSGKNVNTTKSPLSLMVQNRIDIMHGILDLIHPYDYELMLEQTRLIALLSLLESVFNVPMSVILTSIDVDDTIKDALISHSGKLGRIYAITLSLEKREFATAQILLQSYKLSMDDIKDLLYKTLQSD
jgi:EAL and modified HD-GYP domain-containing signal transduction protein